MAVAPYRWPKPPALGKELPYDDDIPMESDWHFETIHLLKRSLSYFWQGRHDIYLGGNQFVYFDPDQSKKCNFRGPDFFIVKGVRDNHHRHSWVIWEEDYLTPDLVIELASESTAHFDVTGKKAIYEQTLKTPEYVVYNPNTEVLRGWRLLGGQYVPIVPNRQGWLWSEEIGLWLGIFEHQFLNYSDTAKTLRFVDHDGQLVPTPEEAAAQRADAEAQRARLAEEELARLKALLLNKK